jgi:ketosteroid isomerase-like protein
MSRENVEVVQRAYEAFNSPDRVKALAELSDDDLEFVSVLTAVDADDATYRGPASWATYFARMDEIWDDWRDLEVFDAGGDRVVAIFRLAGTGKTSGARVDHQIGLAYRMRGGKLWRMRSYVDPVEALEAVGLRKAERDALPEQLQSDRDPPDSADPNPGPITES